MNARLNIYRCLALVCKGWRPNARDVFFEELEALTLEALEGLVKTFQYDRPLRLAVSRISFSFGEFRCSASIPRKPRPLMQLEPPPQQPSYTEEPQDGLVAVSAGGTLPFDMARKPDWKAIHKRDYAAYQPSTVSQGKHWDRWQNLVSQILAMCTSLCEAKIIFTNHTYRRYDRFFYTVQNQRKPWFPPPDMTNDNIINGLLQSNNLRQLFLTDPVPLGKYGPSLTAWERLTEVSIVITRSYPELKDTAFIPPKSLISFRFHDKSRGEVPWPLASDLARCTNLQFLDLAVTRLHPTTATAIGFLVKAYQHTLRGLTLEVLPGGVEEENMGFQNVLQAVAPLHFPKLEYLRLPGSSCDTSFFSNFSSEVLQSLEVGWLMIDPGSGTREEKWARGLSRPSVRNLKELVINLEDPDTLRKRALITVCSRMGLKLTLGGQSVREDEQANTLDVAGEGPDEGF